ncbi:MAG TPA: hypothetical protein VGU68_10035 [Ktedonobacteraceae bacterium]|nr:hypothetical protein [Ktedonobacteraceae bacterium]
MAQMLHRTLHIRFDGRSEEITFAQLHLESDASDAQIKQAVSGHFDLPREHFDDHVIVRTQNAVILRPEALYG